MPNIVILGSSTKSAAYVAKQLSKYGVEVIVYAWLDLPLKHSRYVKKYHLVKSPDTDVAGFTDNLIKYLQLNKTDCLLPINDQALEICKLYYDRLSEQVKIIGVNHSFTDEYAHSKYELIKVSETVGIKTPKTILLNGLKDVEAHQAAFRFPCIVKPESSSILKDNRLYYFKVKRIQSYEQLVDYVRENINNVQMLVQEIIPGYGIGYNIIAQNGVIINEYIHRRIFEYEGESTYRESVQVQEYGLQDKVHALIKKINWSGVAMVEFRIDGSDAYIMEINGRFWGSIEVSVRCGLNYPVQLYEMQFLNKQVERNLPVKYVRVRNLKEEVVNNIRAIVQQRSLKSFFNWLATFKGVLNKNEIIEDNIFNDPGFVVACYYDVIERNLIRLIHSFQTRLVAVSKHQAVVPSGKTCTVGFVCMGNICRSPFAEYYSRKFNPAHQYFSFGTANSENRMSPVNAVKAAESFGVDMTGFSSSTYDAQQVKSADYIFVMDKQNFVTLKEMGVSEGKIFFLGDEEIEDPYGKSLENFSRVYAQIINAIEQKLPVQKAG